MIKRLKKMSKDAIGLTAVGVGLGAASGLGGGAAVGKFTGKIGAIGGVMMAGHTIGIMQDSLKVNRRKNDRRRTI